MSAKLEVLRLAEQAAREAFLLESKHFEAEHSDDPLSRAARPAMDRLLAAGDPPPPRPAGSPRGGAARRARVLNCQDHLGEVRAMILAVAVAAEGLPAGALEVAFGLQEAAEAGIADQRFVAPG